MLTVWSSDFAWTLWSTHAQRPYGLTLNQHTRVLFPRASDDFVSHHTDCGTPFPSAIRINLSELTANLSQPELSYPCLTFLSLSVLYLMDLEVCVGGVSLVH